MSATDLAAIAQAMTAPGKGLLAADESTGTIKKRFDTIGLESTEATRRDYRELLFTTPDLEQAISGAILYDETIRQKTADGTPLAKILEDRGILPGIKVDAGLVSMAGGVEKLTEGLDGLAKRYADYYALGARFAKWRAVYTITDALPSAGCIEGNAWLLARYAAITQQCGLVPIVEPEVLMDGAHTLERCAAVTEAVLAAVFSALRVQGVVLEHMVLKPNMVLPGEGAPARAAPAEVAQATLAVFRRTVPAAVPGIMFLSGGQGDEEATANLNAMNQDPGPRPWAISFSYGRALQAPALKAWGGIAANRAAAQQALRHRSLMNGAAARGQYRPDLERAA